MAARIVDVHGDGGVVKLECLGDEAVDGAAFKSFFFATTPHTQHSHYMPREHRDFLPSAASASFGDVLYFVADHHELKNWSASRSKAHTEAEGTKDCKVASIERRGKVRTDTPWRARREMLRQKCPDVPDLGNAGWPRIVSIWSERHV